MTKKKMQVIVWIVISFIIALLLLLSSKGYGAKLDPTNYYIWGVDPYQNPTFIIPDGYAPTGVIIRINGLTQLWDSPFDTMHIHLMSHPQTGWFSKIDDQTGDIFYYLARQASHGIPDSYPNGLLDDPFLFTYTDLTVGKENVVINLGTIDDPTSHVWKIFKRPFVQTLSNGLTVNWTSSLLIFMDSIGIANNPWTGIGLDPEGVAGFSFDSMTIEVTIETYPTGMAYNKKTFIVKMNIPPVL
jgi:hypothetical protein